MPVLQPNQIEAFRRDGVLVVENAIDGALLAALRDDFAAWVEESRARPGDWGAWVDGRPRFEVEPEHGPETPALRRVQAPTEISEACFRAVVESPVADMVADLIGPDVKLHHSKINSKLPKSSTVVKWHQDFPFTPHSNADLVTALIMIDEVTPENGPLEVVKGSHRGPLMSLWHDGVFTGAVAPEVEADCRARAEMCCGPAGSVCLMHTRLLHGSAPNRSARPRTLLIAVYAAGDAVALSPNPVPSRHDGLFVRGADPGRIRSEAFEIERPEYPKTSFFAQQKAALGG